MMSNNDSLLFSSRILGDGSDGSDDGEHFGVHISYADLYACIVFLSAVYFAGFLTSRFLNMPNLVGEIFAGIVLGPNVLNFVPYAEAFVLLGEVGLILLVLEAGIDIDLTTLKLIGKRGMLIALIGTLLPILIAFLLAYLLGYTGTAAVAAACTFAPTSLGIAMNVLRQSNLVNTPVGQVVVAAAIIDDMIALVILSQLQAFSGDQAPTVLDLLLPVISALSFLFIGGYIAVFVLPKILNKLILDRIEDGARHNREWMSLAIMFALLLGLIPATKAAKASPLMGAFLAGLVFCSSEGTHHMFMSQFKRVLQWLLRIFFAASIGFQVPITKFANPTVFWHGLVFTGALLGKVAVGFLVPNFSLAKRFKGMHLRDCLVVGFSMMAEGEFAFVIAVFAVSNGMMSKDLYASVVLAVLISTILAPFFLRLSISRFSSQMKETIAGNYDDLDASLAEAIRDQTAVFFRIQTKSAPSWGVQVRIADEMSKLNLQVIDHRSWHPRQSDKLLINEMYVLDVDQRVGLEANKQMLQKRDEIAAALKTTLGENAIVKVNRWVPQLPVTSAARSTKEHIIDATRAALDASASFDEGAKQYLRMEEGESSTSSSSENNGSDHTSSTGSRPGISSRSISRLVRERYPGRLNGLFRHDRNSITSGEGIEYYDMQYIHNTDGPSCTRLV